MFQSNVKWWIPPWKFGLNQRKYHRIGKKDIKDLKITETRSPVNKCN